MVKVNPGSSFEQIWKYLSTRCCILSFKVPKKENFDVFSIDGPGSHLGHVTWNIWTNFHSKHPMEVPYEIWLQYSGAFLRREVWKYWMWVILDKGQWPWVVINRHVLICLTTCTNFHLRGFNSFSEIYNLIICPYKSKMDQIFVKLVKVNPGS